MSVRDYNILTHMFCEFTITMRRLGFDMRPKAFINADTDYIWLYGDMLPLENRDD